jgi:hypothetical protein
MATATLVPYSILIIQNVTYIASLITTISRNISADASFLFDKDIVLTGKIKDK